MAKHLIIRPYDADFDIIGEVGKKCMDVYKGIKSYEILSRENLPETVFVEEKYKSNLKDVWSKIWPEDDEVKIINGLVLTFEMLRQRKMIEHLFPNSPYLLLGITSNPIFLGNLISTPFEGYFTADLAWSGAAMVSVHRVSQNNLANVCSGFSLHALGHILLGLENCENKSYDCVMAEETDERDYYGGIYRFCDVHARKLQALT